jgi:hypothetical protein
MNDVPTQLVAALRERLAIVADESSRRNVAQHLERLRRISERVDDLRQRLPKPVEPRLAHFLERSSYDKALEFLEKNQAR